MLLTPDSWRSTGYTFQVIVPEEEKWVNNFRKTSKYSQSNIGKQGQLNAFQVPNGYDLRISYRISLSLPCHGAKNPYCSSFSKNSCVWKSLFNMHAVCNCPFPLPHTCDSFMRLVHRAEDLGVHSDPAGPVVMSTSHLGSKERKSRYCTPRLQSAGNGGCLGLAFLPTF